MSKLYCQSIRTSESQSFSMSTNNIVPHVYVAMSPDPLFHNVYFKGLFWPMKIPHVTYENSTRDLRVTSCHFNILQKKKIGRFPKVILPNLCRIFRTHHNSILFAIRKKEENFDKYETSFHKEFFFFRKPSICDK